MVVGGAWVHDVDDKCGLEWCVVIISIFLLNFQGGLSPPPPNLLPVPRLHQFHGFETVVLPFIECFSIYQLFSPSFALDRGVAGTSFAGKPFGKT